MPATPPARVRVELTALTGIRALAALWVVIEHFRLVIYALFPQSEAFAPWIRSGFLGVEVFFVLSGFIIAYTYADEFSTFSWSAYRKFLELRVARIYPVHLVTLIAFTAMVVVSSRIGIHMSEGENYTPTSFLGQLFNLHGLPYIATWNKPAWSISLEFAAYLAFPALALVLARVTRARSGFGSAVVISLAGIPLVALATATNDSPTNEVVIWVRIAVGFSTGCFLYAGWRFLGEHRFHRYWDLVAVGAMVATMAGLSVLDVDSAEPLYFAPLLALFVLGCAGSRGVVYRALSTKVMLWGGRISYSVYMTHFMVLMILGEILPFARYVNSDIGARIAILGVYLIGSILVGATCYYVIEEPGRKLVRRVAGVRKPPVVSGEAHNVEPALPRQVVDESQSGRLGGD